MIKDIWWYLIDFFDGLGSLPATVLVEDSSWRPAMAGWHVSQDREFVEVQPSRTTRSASFEHRKNPEQDLQGRMKDAQNSRNDWFGIVKFLNIILQFMIQFQSQNLQVLRSSRFPTCLEGLLFGFSGSDMERRHVSGWWFGTSISFSHILGIIIPIDSYFSEGWPNHQPVWNVAMYRWYTFLTLWCSRFQPELPGQVPWKNLVVSRSKITTLLLVKSTQNMGYNPKL